MRSVLCAATVLLAVPAVADDKPPVRALDVKIVKLAPPQPANLMERLIVIRTADELAKSPAFADDASRKALKIQVDFSNEKLVVVEYWDSSSSSIHVELSKDGKTVAFPIVTRNPAKADLHHHVAAFAVPKGIAVASGLDIRNLSLQDVRVDFSQGGHEPKPLEIKSADELAKAAVFADEASRDAIKNQVDFSKDKLVVFVWSGSRRDKFAAAPGEDGRTAVFTYTAGVTDDLGRYAHIFALPKDCEVKIVP